MSSFCVYVHGLYFILPKAIKCHLHCVRHWLRVIHSHLPRQNDLPGWTMGIIC